MAPEADRSSGWGLTSWQIAIWLCLLSAFSPVLMDLSTHLYENAWARTSLIFPWLLWAASRQSASWTGEGSAMASRRMIWIWLLAGLAIELLAVAGGAPRFGRLGLLIAVVGLCHSMHSLRFSVGILFLWALPLPSTLLESFSPGSETFWGQAGAAVIPGLSLEVLGRVPVLTTSTAQMPLVSSDSGIAMAYGLAGLGWYRMISMGRSSVAALLGALRWALLAIPVQLTFILFAGLLLSMAKQGAWPRLFLTESNWLFVVSLGLVLSLGRLCRTTRTQPMEIVR